MTRLRPVRVNSAEARSDPTRIVYDVGDEKIVVNIRKSHRGRSARSHHKTSSESDTSSYGVMDGYLSPAASLDLHRSRSTAPIVVSQDQADQSMMYHQRSRRYKQDGLRDTRNSSSPGVPTLPTLPENHRSIREYSRSKPDRSGRQVDRSSRSDHSDHGREVKYEVVEVRPERSPSVDSQQSRQESIAKSAAWMAQQRSWAAGSNGNAPRNSAREDVYSPKDTRASPPAHQIFRRAGSSPGSDYNRCANTIPPSPRASGRHRADWDVYHGRQVETLPFPAYVDPYGTHSTFKNPNQRDRSDFRTTRSDRQAMKPSRAPPGGWTDPWAPKDDGRYARSEISMSALTNPYPEDERGYLESRDQSPSPALIPSRRGGQTPEDDKYRNADNDSQWDGYRGVQDRHEAHYPESEHERRSGLIPRPVSSRGSSVSRSGGGGQHEGNDRRTWRYLHAEAGRNKSRVYSTITNSSTDQDGHRPALTILQIDLPEGSDYREEDASRLWEFERDLIELVNIGERGTLATVGSKLLQNGKLPGQMMMFTAG